MPLGFNQGGVRVKPYDFTSLIAMTLNSNLYLSGLHYMDYMEMKEKVVPFSQSGDSSGKAGEIFGTAQKFMQLTQSEHKINKINKWC